MLMAVTMIFSSLKKNSMQKLIHLFRACHLRFHRNILKIIKSWKFRQLAKASSIYQLYDTVGKTRVIFENNKLTELIC